MTLALAPHPICREFEADVLSQLRKARATMHGCPVECVECKIDGGVVVWFAGPRDGMPWRGALRFDFPMLRDKKWLADANAVSDAALGCLRFIGSKPQPLIQRAVA